MRCAECPVWVWGRTWYLTPTTKAVPCDDFGRPHDVEEPCLRTIMDLRREATRLRCIADALDRAAEMREREEARA